MRPVLVGALICIGACYAYRPAALTPAPGARVRIVFTTATAVTTIAADSSRHTYPGVLEASGIISAAASDTVALRVDALRTATGALPAAAGQIALLPTIQIARITERRFQAGTTALTGLGVSTLALRRLRRDSEGGPMSRTTTPTRNAPERPMNLGPYADEGRSFAKIHEAVRAAGLAPRNRHIEVYLNDPGRTKPERLRTVLLLELDRCGATARPRPRRAQWRRSDHSMVSVPENPLVESVSGCSCGSFPMSTA
jgi:hypothetical protein